MLGINMFGKANTFGHKKNYGFGTKDKSKKIKREQIEVTSLALGDVVQESGHVSAVVHFRGTNIPNKIMLTLEDGYEFMVSRDETIYRVVNS